MICVLWGEDEFSLRQRLRDIKKGIGEEVVLAPNTAVLDGRQVTLAQLQGVCGTVPFLAEKRLVIIEGLMERFEPGSKSPKKKALRLTEKQDESKSIAAYLGHVPDFTTLVLVDGKVSERNPLLAGLSGKAEIRSFPLLKDSRLRQWMLFRTKEAGGSISPQAVDLLARFVGSNLWIASNEIDKLVLFAGGRRIEEGDVREVVSYAQEANVFAMVDAILESRAGEAERLLRQLLQHGAVPAYLLVMLARQTQIIVRVKELKSQGKSFTQMRETLGLPDFVLRRTMELAERYSLARLREMYHRLLDADLSIKTGRFDGELAMNILIAELCQRASVSTN